MSSDVKRYVWSKTEMVEPSRLALDSGIDVFVDADDYDRAIAERDAAQADRDEYAKSALVAIAGSGIPTPEKGYVADGGWQQMASDIRRMRIEGKHIDKLNEAVDHALGQRDRAQAEVERLGQLFESVVLLAEAFIAKCEQVERQTKCISAQSATCARYARQLDEAVGLLRRWDDPRDDEFNVVSATEDFLARYDAEQTKAQNLDTANPPAVS